MATGTAGTSARVLPLQAVHYLRKTVNYSDTGISTGIAMPNPLPSGASILFCKVQVTTAFNAATTNVLTVGQNATNYNDIVAAGDLDESVTQGNVVWRGIDLSFASDTTVYVKYTQTGAAATAGVARVEIAYTVSNDQ